MTDMDETAVEAVAFALWKNAAQRAAPNVAKYRTIAAFRDDVQDSDRAVWLQSARAAIAANPATARVAKLEEALRWALPLAERAVDDHRMERIRCGHSYITGTYKSGMTWVGIHQSEVDQIEFAREVLAS